VIGMTLLTVAASLQRHKIIVLIETISDLYSRGRVHCRPQPVARDVQKKLRNTRL